MRANSPTVDVRSSGFCMWTSLQLCVTVVYSVCRNPRSVGGSLRGSFSPHDFAHMLGRFRGRLMKESSDGCGRCFAGQFRRLRRYALDRQETAPHTDLLPFFQRDYAHPTRDPFAADRPNVPNFVQPQSAGSGSSLATTTGGRRCADHGGGGGGRAFSRPNPSQISCPSYDYDATDHLPHPASQIRLLGLSLRGDDGVASCHHDVSELTLSTT